MTNIAIVTVHASMRSTPDNLSSNCTNYTGNNDAMAYSNANQ